MYNYFMLIGYVLYDVNIKETAKGKVVNLYLQVRRDFKNSEGSYDFDVIRVCLWEILADLAVDVIKKGSKVIVKGRMKPVKVTLPSGATTNLNELFVDRLIDFSDYNEEFEDIKPEDYKE